MQPTVFMAKKDDPIKEGALDGMAELLDGDDDFVYPDRNGKSAKEILDQWVSDRNGD